MAGEFQEATRLSDFIEAELSFVTEIVNPVALSGYRSSACTQQTD
jgi:hypothetical protein